MLFVFVRIICVESYTEGLNPIRPVMIPAIPATYILVNLLTIEEWHALRISFQVAACAALFGLPFAVAVGYWLARSPARGKWLVEVAVNLPLVLPPVVVGYLL